MNDSSRDKEALALVTAFFHIDDPAIRKTILELARAGARGASFKVTRFERADTPETNLN